MVSQPARDFAGERVVVLVDTSILDDAGNEIDDVWPGLVLEQSEFVDGRVLVRDPYYNDGAPAWLKEAEVTPLEGAVEELTARISLDPDSTDLYLARAGARKELGVLDDALADLNEAVSRDPSARNFRRRAFVRFDLEDFNNAIDDFTAVIELEPSSSLYFFRGDAYMELGNLNKAVDDFTAAIELDPSSDFYFLRADAYIKLENFNKAIDDLTVMISMDPTDGVAFESRGRLRVELEQFDDAIDDFTAAIALKPSWDLFVLRVHAYSELGEVDKAIADVTELIAIDHKDGRMFASRGRLHARAGNYYLAIDDLTTATTLDPSNASAFSDLGNAYAELGEYDKAIADYDLAISIDDTSAIAWNNRGQTLIRLGEFEQALEDFDRCLAIEPSDLGDDKYLAYWGRGVCHMALESLEQADADFSESMRLVEDYEDVLYSLTLVQLILQQPEAVDTAQRTIDAAEDLPEISAIARTLKYFALRQNESENAAREYLRAEVNELVTDEFESQLPARLLDYLLGDINEQDLLNLADNKMETTQAWWCLAFDSLQRGDVQKTHSYLELIISSGEHGIVEYVAALALRDHLAMQKSAQRPLTASATMWESR